MSEVVSERPTSFAQAFESSATESLPVTPSSETPPAEAPPAAAIAPPATEQSADVTPASGPIPFDRHKAILDGAYKERDTAKQSFESLKQKLGWAEALDPSDAAQLQKWSQAYRTDPVAWMAQTIGELRQQFPHLTPALYSEAARILAGAKGQAQAPSFEPDIPVYDDKGQLVAQTFSAAKVQDLIKHAVADAIGKEVSPLKQTVQTVQQERDQIARNQDADRQAKALYETAQQWDGFKEHEQAIAQAWDQHPEWSLQDAYIAVVPAKLKAIESAKTLDKLKTNAAASTVNPSAAVVASQTRPTSFHDKSLKW